MKSLFTLVAVLGCLLIAACGGTTHPAVTTAPAPPPAPQTRCVDGNSFMGCSLPAPKFGSRNLTVPAGRKFIDVSDWQPSVNWKAVKASGVFGVVIKAGEGLREDPTYASHLAGARAAGLQVMAYWFVRDSGCTSEIAAINHVVAKGIRVILDEETPGIAGYAGCLSGPVRSHTGLVPVIYTSPGTWPGGSNAGLSLWQAEYGPALHPAWTPVLAWQFTDSAIVAGLKLDESVDLGLFAKPKPKVDPQHYAWYPNVRWAATHSRERSTVQTWDRARCENPAKRLVCKSSNYHLRLLLGRDQAVYARQTKAQRDANHLPGRIQGLVHRLERPGVVHRWL